LSDNTWSHNGSECCYMSPVSELQNYSLLACWGRPTWNPNIQCYKECCRLKWGKTFQSIYVQTAIPSKIRAMCFLACIFRQTVQCVLRTFWHLRRSYLSISCLTKHRCSAPSVFSLWFTSTLGRRAWSSTKTYVIHVQCTCTVGPHITCSALSDSTWTWPLVYTG